MFIIVRTSFERGKLIYFMLILKFIIIIKSKQRLKGGRRVLNCSLLLAPVSFVLVCNFFFCLFVCMFVCFVLFCFVVVLLFFLVAFLFIYLFICFCLFVYLFIYFCLLF